MTASPAFRLLLLGPPQLTTAAGEVVPMPHRHRLALLMLLAMAPRRVLARDKILALLWPEQDTSGARNLLNVAVHGLRRVLGSDALRSVGHDLTLDATLVAADVWELHDALSAADVSRAMGVYRGRFVDGFHVARAAEFAQWVDATRARLADELCSLLDRASDEATARGDHVHAVTWLRRRSQEDPYNTSAVTRLILAMERAGQGGAALQVALAHEALLQKALEVAPDPAFLGLIERLRVAPHSHLPVPESPVVARSGGGPAGAEGSTTARRRPRHLMVLAATGIALAAMVPFVGPGEESGGVWVSPMAGDSAAMALFPSASDAIIATVQRAVPGLNVRHTGQGSHGRFLTLRRWLHGDTTRAATVTTQVRVGAESVTLDARVVDRMSGVVWRTLRVTAPRDGDPPGLMQQLLDRLGGAIALSFDARLEPLVTAESQPPALEALAAFRGALDDFARADYGRAADGFRRTWQMDTVFDLARIWEMFAQYHGAAFARAGVLADSLVLRQLSEGDRFGVEWLRARLRGDVPAAHRAAREAARRLPRSQWAFARAEEALALRHPHEAIAVLTGPAGSAGWIGGWSGVTRVLAEAYHLAGEYAAEARVSTAGARHGTNRFATAIDQLPHLAARGDLAGMERLVNAALATPGQPTMSPGSIMQRGGRELEAHGFPSEAEVLYRRAVSWYEAAVRTSPESPAALWGLGRMLRAAGEIDSARRVMQRLEGVRPGYHVYADLGLLQAEAGDTAGAWHYDSLLARPAPGLPVFDAALRVMHRAAIRAALGQREEALDFLRRAVALGVPVALDSVHVPAPFRRLRGWAPFADLTRVARPGTT